MNAVASLEMH